MNKFHTDLDKAIRDLEFQVGDRIDKIALDLYGLIKTRTPVDTGALRSDWTITQVSDGYLIINSKPYARRIEYGYSKVKAPEGMARISIIDIRNKYA